MPRHESKLSGWALILPLGSNADGGVAVTAGLALDLYPAGHVEIDGGGRVGRLGARLHADAEAVAEIPRGAQSGAAACTRRDVDAVEAEPLARLLEHVCAPCPPEN